MPDAIQYPDRRAGRAAAARQPGRDDGSADRATAVLSADATHWAYELNRRLQQPPMMALNDGPYVSVPKEILGMVKES